MNVIYRQRLKDRKNPRRGGYTLAELLMSLTLTAIIAIAIAGMMRAVSYGTSSEAGRRGAIVRENVLRAKLNAAIRSSTMILAEGGSGNSDYLVLWMGDTNPNDAPNISELRRLTYDRTQDRIFSYRAPADLSPGSDTQFSLSDDFAMITAGLAGSANFPEQLWATDIRSWDMKPDQADVRQAAAVTYMLDVDYEGFNVSLAGIASLRRR